MYWTESVWWEIIAFDESCENTIREFSSYVWDEKAMERGEDKPVKQQDHAMDAIRYFCNTILGNSKAIIKSKAKIGAY